VPVTEGRRDAKTARNSIRQARQIVLEGSSGARPSDGMAVEGRPTNNMLTTWLRYVSQRAAEVAN